MQKCPMCAWEIDDGGVTVAVGGKQLTVCCDECAAQGKQYSEGRAT